jgi:hypothetical protein
MCCDCFSIRIDKYNSKEVKESIFLAEAREMQNQLLKAAEDLRDAPQLPLSPMTLPPTLVRITAYQITDINMETSVKVFVNKMERITVKFCCKDLRNTPYIHALFPLEYVYNILKITLSLYNLV